MEQLTHFKLPSLGSLRGMKPMEKREFRNGMLFIAPWLFGFLAFTVAPIIATLYFSIIDLKITKGITSPPVWVGLANYQHLLQDATVWNYRPNTSPGAMWVTIRFGLIALPVGILVPLGIALLMNNRYLKGQNFFRSMFYMPYIIPFVASVFLWGGVLNPEAGWINKMLIMVGVPKANVPGWTNDINWVYPAYVLMGIWGIGNAMMITLAGLQGVPTELYDAAKVDGAGSLSTFRNVTFPMISPVIFFNLILTVVGLFQYFLVPLVVNQGTGEPGGATLFYNLVLYRQFFLFGNMSYGSAMAWVLFIFILVFTLFLFYTARFWVFYASERD
jgi:ABC-type sugar transport system permease subunit